MYINNLQKITRPDQILILKNAHYIFLSKL